MASMSYYLSNALVNHILRNIGLGSPSNTYLGLFKSDAGLETNYSGSWAEVSGNAYARVALNNTVFKAPNAGSTENNVDIIFPTATGAWGTVTHIAIMDAATNGNVLLWAPLTLAKTVTDGDSFRILQNDLDILFD